MPRTEYEVRQGSEESASELRNRAERVRRLSRELVNQDDVERMRSYAKELEQRASEVECGDDTGAKD